MENEELAALRATLLAAQRQPLAVKVRQARLSALVADGDELLPYVLSRSALTCRGLAGSCGSLSTNRFRLGRIAWRRSWQC
jgi:hypothetical protein